MTELDLETKLLFEQVKRNAEERLRLQNDAAPMSMGLCCQFCDAWDWKNEENEEAKCLIREHVTGKTELCAAFECECERVRELAEDLIEQFLAWRKI